MRILVGAALIGHILPDRKIQKMNSARHSSVALRRRLLTLSPVFLLLSALAAASPSHVATPPIDAENVAAWADETFNKALDNHAFSGATVSVVRDGEVILSRGYGRADFSQPDPVDPQRTRFRIGSITKTFTATIIAQLFEEGRIASLDDPANRYLHDYQLPDNDGVPITLHHLLTHTAGFEDRFYFIGADEPLATHPPAEVFDKLRPAYVRPAGTQVEYSNFGIAVLGRIIEDITGTGIAQAMEERIFKPLGMRETVLMTDITEPPMLGKPATILPAGTHRETPFTAINPAIAAAGSIASTAEDMTRYMLALLGEPIEPDQPPHFSAAVREHLYTRRASNAHDSAGLGMVFFLDEWAGQPTIAHGGNWTGFHSWMTIVPDLRTGFFVSLMSEGPGATLGSDLRSVFMPWKTPTPSPAVISGGVYERAFLSHFLGERNPLPAKVSLDSPTAASITGWYRPDRRPFTTAESVADLINLGGGLIRVEADSTGITVGKAGPWHHVGDNVFMLDVPTRDRMIIRSDDRIGAPVLIPDLGIYTATRIPWYQHARLHLYIVLAAMLAGIITLALLHAKREPTLKPMARTAAWTTVIASLALIPIAYFGRATGTDMLSTLYAGHSDRLAFFVIIANLLLVAALITIAMAALQRSHSTRARRYLAIIGGAGLVLSLTLAHYNVIGWHVPS